MKKQDLKLKMHLEEPAFAHKESFSHMVKEYNDINDQEYPKYYDRNADSYTEYLQRLDSLRKGEAGIPRTETYFLVDENKRITGTIRFRYELNEQTIIDGGHVGYDIIPGMRGKGYGKEILRLLINKIKDFGLSRILITVEADNIASIRVVKANSGKFENEMLSLKTGKKVKRFWINLSYPDTE